MKKTTKISLMSGLVTAGALLCGVHIANAQTNIDTGYTITIPSEVGIDKDSGKGSFSVSGKMDAQTELDVTTSSQNDYKLKCGSQFVDYTLDKQSFHIDNIKSANPKSFNEDFNITLANTNTNYSGPYKDRLAFNIQCHKYTYELDMNSILDGKVEFGGHNYGTVDVYINGERVADDVSNFNGNYPYGTEFEFKDLKGTDGHHYAGVGSIDNVPPIPLKGRIGIDVYCVPRANAPHILCTPCYFKFDTNKLTLNYHADGAQTWNNFQNIIHDVSNKDIAYSETKKYGATFDSRAGLADVLRLTKLGYTATEHTWTIGKAGTRKVMDNVGLAKMEDVAKYCGVLDKFKKNDVTIDLYPIWEPLLNTITYDANGGTLSTAKTQQFYTGTPYKTPENSKSFSGTNTDDCEDLGYYNYSFGNKLTISAKIRFNSSDDTLPQKLQEFFCNYEWAGFGLGLGEDAKPYFSVFRENKDDYDILRSKAKIKPNETYWITGVYDSPNNTMSIYINGEKTNTIQLSATDNPNIKVSPLGLSLGGNPIVGDHYSNLTKGDIWKCGLWQNALSDEEVMKMYKTDTLAEGSFISRDYSAPKKTYYLFDGWYTQPTGGNKITTGTIINSSMTLYAHYKPILSFINYDSNEGTGVMQSETILSTDKTNLSKNIFTKDGYTFKGWLASRKYKSNVEYLYVNPNGGGGWFEKGEQPSGWSKLYLLSDEEPIYLISAYDGLTLTFHAQWEKAYSAGTVLNIDGDEYIIINKEKSEQYLIINKTYIGTSTFQMQYDPSTYLRPDDKYANIYENSTIDKYLENTWYKNLSSSLKNAIIISSIKQNVYSNQKDPNSKQENGFDDQTYNVINRHVFLPSIEELKNLIDLDSPDKVNNFLNGSYMWTRDAYQNSKDGVEFFNYYLGCLLSVPARDTYSVRPAFVIDLSKVNYTVTGSVNYK
mgnify:CR=1 FL=1